MVHYIYVYVYSKEDVLGYIVCISMKH